MSTLVLEVNQEQEKVLETLLAYMNISFQRVSTTPDFWDSLSPQVKSKIEQGLSDAELGKYSSASDFMQQLLAK